MVGRCLVGDRPEPSGMEFQPVEDLVDLFSLPGHCEPDYDKVVGGHSADGGSIVDVISRGEEIFGVDTQHQIAGPGAVEGTANASAVAALHEHWNPQHRQIDAFRSVHILLADQFRLPGSDSADDERRDVQLLPAGRRRAAALADWIDQGRGCVQGAG